MTVPGISERLHICESFKNHVQGGLSAQYLTCKSHRLELQVPYSVETEVPLKGALWAFATAFEIFCISLLPQREQDL
jgi:hypothetical protein